ncbi:MAG: hypothetical protein ACM3QZ_03500 [Solirubrobacterales bacterium]
MAGTVGRIQPLEAYQRVSLNQVSGNREPALSGTAKAANAAPPASERVSGKPLSGSTPGAAHVPSAKPETSEHPWNKGITDTLSERLDPDIRAQKRSGTMRCETCASRTYQDGSDDPGVSFKSPTHVAPEAAASAVMGHEQQHVVRERAEARQENRQVVSQSVSIQTSVCPECGKSYVSGGVTRTTTVNKSEESQSLPANRAVGMNLDKYA